MADPISNVLSEVEHSITAGIYSTCYIFYFLFVHGYIPVREARDILKPLTLIFERSQSVFSLFCHASGQFVFVYGRHSYTGKVHVRYKERKNFFNKWRDQPCYR